jgi:predicted NBD/HSP70 family sugar kinase
LSRSTVSAIVGDLIASDLVGEVEVTSVTTRSGRPPIGLAFRDHAFGIVGIEMGASHVTAVLSDPRGQILFSQSEEFDVQGDPQGTLTLLHRFVEACLCAAGDRAVIGVGLGVPCPLDTLQPGTLSRRILPSWADIRIGEELFARHHLPVFVDNDANLGALAEHWWGACVDVSCATYIKVATGVGAGHVIDGRIFRGSTGIAGEIGHTAVTRDGRPCRCGLQGCLEAEIGSAAITQRARERLARGEPSILSGLEGPLSLETIVGAARDGDALSVALIEEAGRHLGVAVANLLNLMNPARVVIGGRLASAGDLLLTPLKRAIQDRALWTSIERADVTLTTLGDDHVAIGAATLVLEAALAAPQDFTRPRQLVPDPLSTGRVRAPVA